MKNRWPAERFMLFHWMWEFADLYRFRSRALALAYGLFEETMGVRGGAMSREELQCYACAALSLASKFEGAGAAGPPDLLYEMADATEDAYHRLDLTGAELDIVVDANWRVHRRLLYDDLGEAVGNDPLLWKVSVCVLLHAQMAGCDVGIQDVLDVAEALRLGTNAREGLGKRPRKLLETIEANAAQSEPYCYHARDTFRAAGRSWRAAEQPSSGQ